MDESITTETHAIIVAAGKGERAGLSVPKQFSSVNGKPMLRHSVETFLKHRKVKKLWIVIAEGQETFAARALDDLNGYEFVTGSDTRQQSVINGLDAIAKAGGCSEVLIHDAARPFITDKVIDDLLNALEKSSGAIPVLATVDTMITLDGNSAGDIVDRSSLWRVQTPQAFEYNKLYSAHKLWLDEKVATDDAQIFRAAGHKVAIVEGHESFKKYTTLSDFEDISMNNIPQTRTGMGYDVHQLATDEELWLGGIKIDHDKGLAGHSDADVALHALTDALLGAVGAGDIGDHFPPSDPQWQGAPSRRFVEFAATMIRENSAQINNVDLTIICEAPKIKPHREAMRQNIADMLALDLNQVSVKATTTEGLGFTGRKEGIAAQAIATITMEKNNA